MQVAWVIGKRNSTAKVFGTISRRNNRTVTSLRFVINASRYIAVALLESSMHRTKPMLFRPYFSRKDDL